MVLRQNAAQRINFISPQNAENGDPKIRNRDGPGNSGKFRFSVEFPQKPSVQVIPGDSFWGPHFQRFGGICWELRMAKVDMLGRWVLRQNAENNLNWIPQMWVWPQVPLGEPPSHQPGHPRPPQHQRKSQGGQGKRECEGVHAWKWNPLSFWRFFPYFIACFWPKFGHSPFKVQCY